MAITIINKSPYRQSAMIGDDNTLFVYASSTDELEYQWYSSNGTNLIPGAIDSTYSVPNNNNLSSGFRVRVTNKNNLQEFEDIDFTFQGSVAWFDGVPNTLQIVPKATSNATILAKNVRGTLQVYNNYQDLTNAAVNFERIQAGQLACVLYDVPAIDPETQQPQEQQLINRFYRCQVQSTYDKRMYWNDVLVPAYERLKNNAKYWYQDPVDAGTGQDGAAEVTLDQAGYITGIVVTEPGTGYDPGTTRVGLSSDQIDPTTGKIVDFTGFNPQIYYEDAYNNDPVYTNIFYIPEIRFESIPLVGPFSVKPKVVIFTGQIIDNYNLPPPPAFIWTVSETPDPDADWVAATFLNAEPDNDTIIVEDGLVKARSTGGGEMTWTKTDPAKAVFTPTLKMSALEGLYGIEVLEKAVYPYQPVTLSLTAQNIGFGNTDLLNEVSTSITIRNIHVYADNFENICANTLGASSITLSAIVSDGVQSITSSLGFITKASLSQGFGNLSVTISKTGLNQNHTVTIIAAATELGENDDRTHVVTASTQIQWCYNKYYLKDSNPTVSNTITIPNSAGRELSFVPQGSYDFPYTVTPQYLWILLPTHMSVNHIGTADHSVPFYSDAGNNLITTNIIIERNGQPQSYKGYRSYWPTAADYTVTI